MTNVPSSTLPTFADIAHRHAGAYDPMTGLWKSRAYASIVAEALRKRLANLHPRLSDSRFVAVEKHGGNYMIEFPRIQQTWLPSTGPKDATEFDINEELERIFNEFKKDLEL
jgi:hypothetical protein